MQRATHLLTSRTSTGRPAESEGTRMQHENEQAGDATENSTSGTSDAPENEQVMDLGSWMKQAVAQSLQGMAEQMTDQDRRRAAVLHTARMIVPDAKGYDLMAAAQFILGEQETD